MSEARAIYQAMVDSSHTPEAYCDVCDARVWDAGEIGRNLCWDCQRWPDLLVQAHCATDAGSPLDWPLRIAVVGGAMFEFSACLIDGPWVSVHDERYASVALHRKHIVAVWREDA